MGRAANHLITNHFVVDSDGKKLQCLLKRTYLSVL